MFCNEIGWYDLQIRQVSGKLADCAVQFANWLDNLPIGRLANLQIGHIGRLGGIYTCINVLLTKHLGNTIHYYTARDHRHATCQSPTS